MAYIPTKKHPPFQSFKVSLEQLSLQYISSSTKRAFFTCLTSIWRHVFHVGPKEIAIQEAFDEGKDGFERSYQATKTLFYPEYAASLILSKTSETNPVCKAAQLITSALDFRRKLLTQQFETEFESKKPLDMQRYSYFFSRLHKQFYSSKPFVSSSKVMPPSDYVIVAIDGHYFRLTVLKEELPFSYNEIFEQLSSIVFSAQSLPENIQPVPIGLLTTLLNKKSIKFLQKMEENNTESAKILDEALFFVALDLTSKPKDLEEAARTIHAGNYYNRDYRRSLQIIVTGNCEVGIIVDPRAGIGGTFSARLASELVKNSILLERQPLSKTPGNILQTKPIHFSFRPDHELFTQLETEISKHFYDKSLKTIYKVSEIGLDFFRQHNVSADAVFHCALHLAYYRYFNKAPCVANFINLRTVQQGNIWCYPCTTNEMIDFIKQPTVKNFTAATLQHKLLVKHYKKADDPLYHLSMGIVSLVENRRISRLALITLAIILNLFIRDFFKKSIFADVVVSHIPGYKEIRITGRPGIRLGYLGKNAFAGHYMIFKNHITICLLHTLKKNSHYGKEAEFAKELEKSLEDVCKLVFRV